MRPPEADFDWSPGTEDIEDDAANLGLDAALQRREHAFGHSAPLLLERWLTKEALHRIQGDWALIVDERVEPSQPMLPRTAPLIVPVSSLGVKLVDKLAFLGLCGMRPSATILVRVELADVPEESRPKLEAAATAAIGLGLGSGCALLRVGGPLRKHSPWASCRSWMVVAWAYNLLVLFLGAAFFLFAYLVLFEDAEPRWVAAVWLSFLLSLLLSFVVADVVASLIIACLPTPSTKTGTPIDLCVSFLVSLLEEA
jgi:hypothetical protein